MTFHGLVAGLAATAVFASPAIAQDKEPIRVGVIYDFTGPFAAGGSEPGAVGTQIAIDMINAGQFSAGYPAARASSRSRQRALA